MVILNPPNWFLHIHGVNDRIIGIGNTFIQYERYCVWILFIVYLYGETEDEIRLIDSFLLLKQVQMKPVKNGILFAWLGLGLTE